MTTPPASSTSASPAPSWAEIHFNVDCPRCGGSLNGHTGDTCPACTLLLDWDRVLPLDELACPGCSYHLRGLRDARCPECGEPFDWSAVLGQQRRRDKPLFEYQYRKRFVRSLLAAVRRSLLPGRLWRSIEVYDPPDSRGQAVLAITLALWLVLAMPVVSLLSRTALTINAQHQTGWQGADALIQTWRWSDPEGLMSADFWLGRSSLAIPYGSISYFGFLLIAVVTLGGGLGTLLLLRESMRRCRVRNGHITRACLYAVMPPLVALTLTLLCIAVVTTTNHLGIYLSRAWRVRLGDVIDLSPLIGLAMMVRSVSQAYRHYIRMPHAAGVALAAGAIGAGCGMTLYALVWLG